LSLQHQSFNDLNGIILIKQPNKSLPSKRVDDQVSRKFRQKNHSSFVETKFLVLGKQELFQILDYEILEKY